jgi:hypothetical protein
VDLISRILKRYQDSGYGTPESIFLLPDQWKELCTEYAKIGQSDTALELAKLDVVRMNLQGGGEVLIKRIGFA